MASAEKKETEMPDKTGTSPDAHYTEAYNHLMTSLGQGWHLIAFLVVIAVLLLLTARRARSR
jgi:ABC-type multidrug transport system permease subunit